MKKGLGTIVSFVLLFAGIIIASSAQYQISNDPWSWLETNETYEMQRIIGIVFIIIGALGTIKTIYTNRHVKDVNVLTKKGGTMNCPNCNLTLAANVTVCPRCGESLREGTVRKSAVENTTYICGKCGSRINIGVQYCPKCGEKNIMYRR